MSDRRISVNIKELINSLNRLKVQTGSLACLGCGHEHNCGVHGCAIMREAADKLQAVAEFCERRSDT